MKIIITSYPNKPKELKQFIMTILGKKLAQCINRLNYMKSYYWWEGKIQTWEEKLLLIKTSDGKVSNLIEHIEKHHPYETPEIISLSPEQVNDSYLQYITDK